MTSTKLTAAQTTALRYIATLADEGRAAADALGTRFPRADVQKRLVALGLATEGEFVGALVKITDAGRAAITPAPEPEGIDEAVEAPAPVVTYRNVGEGLYEVVRDGIAAGRVVRTTPAHVRLSGARWAAYTTTGERVASGCYTRDDAADRLDSVLTDRAREVEVLLDEVETRADAEHAADEEQRAVDLLAAMPVEADRIRASHARKRAEVIEADVPPTTDERVTVPIRASELRPGDEVVDSLGERQYAAFDVQQVPATFPGGDGLARVWTAIRDQEAGLPPVITVNGRRDLLVLRPLSEEGRELLAALDRP